MKFLAWSIFVTWFSLSFGCEYNPSARYQAFRYAKDHNLSPNRDFGCGYLSNPDLNPSDYREWLKCAKDCGTESYKDYYKDYYCVRIRN